MKKLEIMLSDPLPEFSFRKAIARPGRLNLIAEFKRKSPSLGDINLTADPAVQSKLYRKNGASAISVLTEEDYFNGRLDDIRLIKSKVLLPVLRKDFIIDPMQITEARAFGADAVLLIIQILDPEQLNNLYLEAQKLNLDCLFEVNSEDDIEKAISIGAKIIGINNRDLKTLKIDLNTTKRLRRKIPPGITVVSESGIRNSKDALFIHSCGLNAVLV